MSELAEKNLIGYLLMDSNRTLQVANKLRKEMFKKILYADIFKQFVDGMDENKEVNVVTIRPILYEKYEKDTVDKVLIDCVKDIDLQVSFNSCIESIVNDYKVKEYGDRIKGSLPRADDVNDAIRQTIAELETLLEEKQEEIKSVSELVKENKDNYFKPGIEKKKTYLGLREVDKMIGGVEGGDVVILAARPAVGKSALALQIIDYNAKKGKRVGYFNLEMQESQVYERLAAKASGIEMARIRNATRFLNDEEQKFSKGNEILMKYENVFVRSGSATVNDLRLAVKNGNYDVVVLDYLQLLKPNKSRGANRYAEVGDISRGVKAIAMDFDVPIIALSQLNRASEGKEDREPNMSELRESGDIEQDASVIIMLWNSDKDDKTKKKIKVDKARQGRLGTQELTFSGATMTFTEVAKNNSRTEDTDGFVKLPDNDDSPFT